MLGLHKNGSLHSQEWVEEGLQRPSPLLLICLLLLVRVQGRGVIIASSCISTHLTPGAHSSLVVTQMALVKCSQLKAKAGIVGKGLLWVVVLAGMKGRKERGSSIFICNKIF